ncbi:MAG: hypothetical protein KGM96_06310 [Acidobacteriota bacterium]|nr:hypothetical protein [Acidobacteriota bacterium]
MIEIVQLLQQKAGLSEDQSQEVAQAIANLIRSKIPESLQGTVMPLLGFDQGAAEGQPAQAAQSGGLGGLLSAAEGMFGENKG